MNGETYENGVHSKTLLGTIVQYQARHSIQTDLADLRNKMILNEFEIKLF